MPWSKRGRRFYSCPPGPPSRLFPSRFSRRSPHQAWCWKRARPILEDLRNGGMRSSNSNPRREKRSPRAGRKKIVKREGNPRDGGLAAAAERDRAEARVMEMTTTTVTAMVTAGEKGIDFL